MFTFDFSKQPGFPGSQKQSILDKPDLSLSSFKNQWTRQDYIHNTELITHPNYTLIPRLTPLPTLGKVSTPIPKACVKVVHCTIPLILRLMTPIRHLSETENISSSYRLLSSSATHRWKWKKERERRKIAPKHCGRSHMALTGAVRHSTKAGRRNKKRQFLILYLYTRYIPILAEESCGAFRQGGICQNDRASEGVKKRAWEQTSCFAFLPKNTSAPECFLVMSLDRYKNGNQYL